MEIRPLKNKNSKVLPAFEVFNIYPSESLKNHRKLVLNNWIFLIENSDKSLYSTNTF